MPAKKSINDEVAEIRKLREEVEAMRRDVAKLNGRLDLIEVFLNFKIVPWQPTEAQKEFAKKHNIGLTIDLSESDGETTP